MTNKEDCVVIGAGIIGVMVAYLLSLDGRSITLIDSNEPGSGCSFGNAGHIATEQIFPLPNPALISQIPKMLFLADSPLSIKPSYMPSFLPWGIKFLRNCHDIPFEQGTIALKMLNQNSLCDWKDILNTAMLEQYLVHKGSLLIFNTPQGQEEGTKALNEFFRNDISVQKKTREALLDMVPALTHKQYGGLFFPETSHCISPHGLVWAIYEKFRQNGGTFVSDRVVGFRKISSSEAEVIMPGHSLTAKNIFICAGVESKALMKSLDLHIPLIAERGYHIMIPNPGVKLDLPLSHHERKFIITPMDDGIRLAGTVEFAAHNDSLTQKRSRMLVKFAREILPDLSQDAQADWVGSRPTLPDYLPVLDREGNFFFAFGHNHLGLTQAATTAKHMAGLLRGESPKTLHNDHGENPFSITRFQ